MKYNYEKTRKLEHMCYPPYCIPNKLAMSGSSFNPQAVVQLECETRLGPYAIFLPPKSLGH